MSDATPTARDAATASLERAYDSVLFVGRPWPNTHPARMATIARLVGIEVPDPRRARVLEVGCGDGGNLVPIAAASPEARLVGIDLSQRAIGEARAFAGALGLANVRFIHGDLRELPTSGDTYDYIIAHGFHSWVPPPVRDALFETIRETLADDGIAFVSHNTLPGCSIRKIVWEVLRSQTDAIESPPEKFARARVVAALMSEAMRMQPGLPQALAGEFDDIASRPDFMLMHDDIAPINDPVLLRDFAAQADRHGLTWLADADLFKHIAPAFGERANAWIDTVGRIEREHLVDHIRLRRFRESLVVRAGRGTGTPVAATRLEPMHLSAANSLVEQPGAAPPPPASDRSPAAMRRRLLDRLVAAHPASIPVRDLVAWIAGSSAPGSALAQPEQALHLLLRAALAGMALPHAEPVPVATRIGERPVAFAPARWQAQRRDFVVNRRHDAVALHGEAQRRLLPLLDGTRDRAGIAARAEDWNPPGEARHALDDHLAHFLKLGVIDP